MIVRILSMDENNIEYLFKVIGILLKLSKSDIFSLSEVSYWLDR
jgi:transposase